MNTAHNILETVKEILAVPGVVLKSKSVNVGKATVKVKLDVAPSSVAAVNDVLNRKHAEGKARGLLSGAWLEFA